MKSTHIVMLSAVLATLLWPMRTLAAGPPMETTFSATLVNVEVQSVTELPGGIRIEDLVLTWSSSGDWVGTFEGLVRNVAHRNGVSTANAFFTFEGSVLGVAGTLVLHHVGTFRSDGSFKGNNTIISGTGGLSHLRGQGKNTSVVPGVIEGTVFVQFTP